MLGATFDTLPSPTNLKRWHITTEADCSLCSVKVCTTAHVLSGCKVALSQGRYTFRHDSILRVLRNSLSKFLSSMSPVKACLSLSSCFVKQGKILCSSKKKPHVGILHECSAWKLSVDFDSSLVFPSFIAITSSRPDIVIYSVLKDCYSDLLLVLEPFWRLFWKRSLAVGCFVFCSCIIGLNFFSLLYKYVFLCGKGASEGKMR